MRTPHTKLELLKTSIVDVARARPDLDHLNQWTVAEAAALVDGNADPVEATDFLLPSLGFAVHMPGNQTLSFTGSVQNGSFFHTPRRGPATDRAMSRSRASTETGCARASGHTRPCYLR